MPLAPGTKLGPYEISEPLGSGGMGEVYRASDSKLKREVAVKVLPAEFATDPQDGALRTRSPGSGFLESCEHRLHPWPGRIERHPRAGDGAGRRNHAGEAYPARSTTTRRSAGRCETDRRGAGIRARARHHSSRPKAR